ncbi:uncharacterized protein [Miscanthus floridulus]|uniref:uncharacterized protein isoform X2 n=1 Tax=Miscanthus floridulus TaxID=154761 RepID=UPI00345AB9C5
MSRRPRRLPSRISSRRCQIGRPSLWLKTIPQGSPCNLFLRLSILHFAFCNNGYFLLERRSCRSRWGVHLLIKLKQACIDFPSSFKVTLVCYLLIFQGTTWRGCFENFRSMTRQEVELKEGPLEQFAHEMEPFLRKQGLPVRLNKGVVELVADHVVCEEGKPLSPGATNSARSNKLCGCLGYRCQHSVYTLCAAGRVMTLKFTKKA